MTDAAIARQLGLDRETVAKWRGQPPPESILRVRSSQLDEFRSYLSERLEEFPELSARVLYRELTARGYEGGYERVKIVCRGLRGDPRVEAVARFETGPGEQAQADWLETKHYVEHEGQRRRLNAFIYVLGYSRWSYLEFSVSEAQAVLFRCFENAFREAGGVPAAILVDNMKAAILDHRSEEIVFNPAFLAFADHWGFQPLAAAKGRGQTKGKAEAGVKYVKRNCLAGQRPATLEAAQAHRNWWLGEVCNVRIHETTHQPPVDRLAEEREHLRPLAAGEFHYRPQLGRRVYLDFTVRWQDNFYEVPYQYAGQRVLAQEVGRQLSILFKGQEIARHDLLDGVGQTAHLPEHKEGLYRPSYPSHLPYQREAFLKLFPEQERFVEGCVKRFRGNAAYHLHKVRELVKDWGRDNVDLAVEQAVLIGAFNIRAVRQACRRLCLLPPPQTTTPPRRVLYLPGVERRSLKCTQTMSAELPVMANPEYEQLLENLRLLKLGSLVPVLEAHLKRAAKGSVSYQDFLAGLVREALEVRAQRTRERRLAACRFPFIRRLEDFDWPAQPTLNRAEVERLGSLRFIDDHDNVAFLEPPGLGKTMLAVALGVAAVESGYTVRFARLDEWAQEAEAAQAAGELARFLIEWVRPQLIVLDEVAHQRLAPVAGRAFAQLLTRRYTTGSVVLTSNRGFESWNEFLGDEVVAASVLDRFLHFATVLTHSGESYRLKEAKSRRRTGR